MTGVPNCIIDILKTFSFGTTVRNKEMGQAACDCEEGQSISLFTMTTIWSLMPAQCLLCIQDTRAHVQPSISMILIGISTLHYKTRHCESKRSLIQILSFLRCLEMGYFLFSCLQSCKLGVHCQEWNKGNSIYKANRKM